MHGPAGFLELRTTGTGPAALVLHPHPLHGGTMGTRLVYQIWRQLSKQYATTRFNFRGVGRSEGSYAHGAGEVADALAVAAHTRTTLIVGFSFGGAVAALVAAQLDIAKLVIIATPNQIRDSELQPLAATYNGECHVIIGDQDPFVPVTDAQKLATHLHATLHVIPGADHFLQPSHHDAVLDIVAAIT